MDAAFPGARPALAVEAPSGAMASALPGHSGEDHTGFTPVSRSLRHAARYCLRPRAANAPRAIVLRVLDAVRLLTAIPAGTPDRPVAATGVALFPLVGVLVGLFWVVTAGAIDLYTPTTVAAGLVLAVDGLVTGGRHLDAVGRIGERRGGTSATPILLLTLVRFAVLMFLVDFGLALLAAPVAGRVGMVGGIAVLRRDLRTVDVSAAWGAALVFAVLVGALPALLVAGGRGLLAVAVALLVGLAGGAWHRQRAVGQAPGQPGQPDDVVFALALVAETAALLVLGAR